MDLDLQLAIYSSADRLQDAHPKAPRSRHTEGPRTQDLFRQELPTDTEDLTAGLRARARSGRVSTSAKDFASNYRGRASSGRVRE